MNAPEPSFMRSETPSKATRDEVAQALSSVLASGNDLEKCLAAQGLGKIGSTSAEDVLIAALRDPDEDVRIDAAAAISALNIDAAVPVMIENIAEDPTVDGKLAVIEAVGHFKAKEAVPLLRKLVRDLAEDDVTWDEQDMAESAGDDWLEIQLKAVEALGRIGAPEAISDIRAAMEDEFGQDLIRPGLTALAGMGPEGMAVVMSYLGSDVDRHRRVATSVLSSCAGSSLAGVAAKLLQDQDPQVRLIALEGLSQDDPLLESCASDINETVRAAAATRLVALNPERLETFLDDKSDAVRVTAIRSYAASEQRPGISGLAETLSGWLEDRSPALAMAAAEALPLIAGEDCFEPLRALALRRGAEGMVRRAAIKALASLDPQATIETLVTIARDPLRPIRLEAVGGLAQIAKCAEPEDRVRAGRILLSALNGSLVLPPEDDPEEKSEDSDAPAAEPFGQRAAKEDDAASTRRIRIDRDGNIVPQEPEKDAENAEPAGAADDDVEDEDRFPVSTLDALQDGLSGPAAEAAGDGLKLTEEDLSFLELAQGRKGKRILSHEKATPAHTDVRILAARTLGDIPSKEVVDGLVAALGETDDELRRAAAAALASQLATPDILREETARDLVRHLGDKDPIVRLWLTRAAAKARTTALLEPLRSRLEDDDPVVRAEAVLGVSRADEAFDPCPFLHDDNMTVRQCAGRALVERAGSDACTALIDLAFGNGGVDRLNAARLLLEADPESAGAAVIERLNTATSALERRVAIEVLSELHAAS